MNLKKYLKLLHRSLTAFDYTIEHARQSLQQTHQSLISIFALNPTSLLPQLLMSSKIDSGINETVSEKRMPRPRKAVTGKEPPFLIYFT